MNQGPPDPHVPESQPTKQGRRLIRMLFRSAADDSKSPGTEGDSRAEDIVAWKKTTIERDDLDKHAPIPSKFASLKRKLFPSQNRRLPRHVPPLISPISAPVRSSLPPLRKRDSSLNQKSSSRDYGSDPAQDNECPSETEIIQLKQDELHSPEDQPESDSHPLEGDNNWRPTDRRTLMDDDDDVDLEDALEALDLESSVADDKTLEEMSKVIDDLRVWKENHENETQEALDRLKTEQERQLLSTEPSQDPTSCDANLERHLERKRLQQQRERETQSLELQKEAKAYQLECNLFRTKLDESKATRVEQALQNCDDSEGLALSRLRNELFQLDVKQRQETLLMELQGPDNELDMNIVDVQAFTGELDVILAQFDTPGIDESNGP